MTLVLTPLEWKVPFIVSSYEGSLTWEAGVLEDGLHREGLRVPAVRAVQDGGGRRAEH